MAKDMHFVPLFDLYAPLLSEHQRDIFDCYYNCDLTLSELSENFGITRQGAQRLVKAAEARLNDIESRLGFYEKAKKDNALALKISLYAQAIAAGEDIIENAGRIDVLASSIING